MKKKTVAYLRVSTGEQTTENQRAQVLELAATHHLEVDQVLEETASAAGRRPELERLMGDARARRVGTVAVWSLDRFDRSMVGAIQRVLELDALGVRVLSVRESWLDTAGPVRSLLVAIFGWVAEQEREQLRARTLAGIERARRQGKHVGRPPANAHALTAAAWQVSRGSSVDQAARMVGVSKRTLERHLARTRVERGEGGGGVHPDAR